MTQEQLNKAQDLKDRIHRAAEYLTVLQDSVKHLKVPKSVSETVFLEYVRASEHENEYRDDLIELREKLLTSITSIMQEHAKKYQAAFDAL